MITTVTRPASDKQLHWLRVFAERLAADASLITAIDAATLTAVMDAATEPARPVSSRDASAALDELFALPRPAAAALAVGGYARDGVVYRVQLSKSTGRPYAMTLDPTGKTDRRTGEPAPAWVYTAGAIHNLTAAHALDLDTARAYGTLTGICAICGARLTDPVSVERGIGPVCAARFE